jgi:hypothetical protein
MAEEESVMADDERRAAICTCDPKPPVYEHAVARGLGIYATYLSAVEDDTRFDSACPFHGEHGSMVVRINTGGSDG